MNTITTSTPEHWTSGGTGLTNFMPSQLPLYEETIKQLGDPNYHVLLNPMGDLYYGYPSMYSLHVTGIGSYPSCQSFWNVFDKLKKSYFKGQFYIIT